MKKHSILIGRRITSISVEDVFWISLQQIARGRQMTRSDLVASVDAARKNTNLSSAIRVFVLDYYRAMATEKLRPEVNEERSDLPTSAAAQELERPLYRPPMKRVP